MDSIKLWARKGEAVRQAIELGEIAHLETASEELTDEFLLFAIDLLYPSLLTPVASHNPLLYQSLPTSIHYQHAMWRRRKDDTGLGTTASGTVT